MFHEELYFTEFPNRRSRWFESPFGASARAGEALAHVTRACLRNHYRCASADAHKLCEGVHRLMGTGCDTFSAAGAESEKLRFIHRAGGAPLRLRHLSVAVNKF
jgi:hypothetical protein